MRLFFKLFFLSQLFLFTGFQSFAQCPSTAGATNTVTDISCFGLTDGTIYIHLSGGSATPTNYELYDVNLGTIIPSNVGGVTKDIDADFKGVKFDNVYASSFAVFIYKAGIPVCSPLLYAPGGGLTVTEPTQLAASPVTTADCDPLTGNPHKDGSITLNPSGGNTPYDFLWSDGSTQENINNADAGTYSVLITDQNNCTLTISNIQVLGNPTITLGANPIVCTGTTSSSISYSATSESPNQYRIDWNVGGPPDVALTALPASPIPINGIPLGTGPYNGTLFVSNSGCESVGYPISVTVNPIPTATISYTGSPFCATGTANVTQTGQSGGTYSSTAGLSINATTGQLNLTTSTAGTYTITYSFTDGTCSNTTTTSVTINALPTATISYASPFCATGTASVTQTGQAGGTYSSTAGLSINAGTGQIDLATSTPGTYTVTYSFTNGTCSNTTTTSVTINALPTATISYASPFCATGTASVTQTGQAGGTYSSTVGLTIDSSTGQIDLVASSPGTYTVTYSFSNGTCSGSTTSSVIINAIPDATFGGLSSPYCVDAVSVTLTPTTIGGTFSGPGISGSSFDPAVAGVGTHTITYSITVSGCTNSTTQNVTVNALPDATFSGLVGPYCTGSGTVTLTPASAGGTFSGPGISGSVFDPTTAGVGTHSITYIITVNGCTSSTSQNVTVLNGSIDATFSGLTGPYCEDASAVTLTPVTAGGTFSGPGVSGSTFDPAIAGAGTHTIQYSVTSGGCTSVSTQNVTVNALPDASFSGLTSPICTDASAITLTPTTAGGTFSGTGVTGSTFDPSVAGAGTFAITYSVTVNGCLNSTSQNVTVDALPDASFSGLVGPYCADAAAVTLTPTVAGGTFSGTGVTGSTFDPAVSGAGTFVITYTLTVGSCTNTSSQNVTVNPLPDATFSGLTSPLCINASAVTLTPVTAGGTFTGTGISGNTFDPAVAGLGTFSITYTVTDGNGCMNSSNQSVTVNDVPDATFSGLAGPYCTSSGSVMLTPTTVGGTFSGPGVSASTFDPATAGAGTHTITYTITVGGCTSSSNQNVDVINGSVDATFSGLAGPYCEDASAVTLTPVTAGGTFSGPGVSGNSFDPAAAGAGTHTIQYSVVSGGCTSVSTQSVIVNPLPDATFSGLAGPYCTTSGTVTLTPTTVGGTFSGTGITGNSFDPATAGAGTFNITYSITVNGCTSSTTQSVDVISGGADPSFSGLTGSYCANASAVTLTPVTAGGTFSGTGVSGNTFDPSVAGAGTFTIQYSINSGGCTSVSSQTVTVDVLPDATFTGLNATYCANAGASALVPTTAGGTFSGPGISGSVFNPSTAGAGVHIIQYSVTVSGCTNISTQSVTVLSVADPLCAGGNCATVVIIPQPSPATCTLSNGSIHFDITPPTPAINNTGVKIDIVGPVSRTNFNNPDFAGLPAGVYNYTIEYGDVSCIKTGTVTIDKSGTVGTPLVSNPVSPVCFGASTGSVTIDVAGETGNPLQWSLTPADAASWIDFTAGQPNGVQGLPAGDLVVSIRRTSSDPCYAAAFVTITESATQITAAFSVTDATCGNSDGVITITTAPAGGTGGPYTFELDGALTVPTSNAFSNLAGGNHTVTVIDNSACERDFVIYIPFPDAIQVDAVSSSDGGCGTLGSITVLIKDFIPSAQYEVGVSNSLTEEPTQYFPQYYVGGGLVVIPDLARGSYFVWLRTGSGQCPTVANYYLLNAPIVIGGSYPISFEFGCREIDGDLTLTNVTGAPGSFDYEVTGNGFTSSGTFTPDLLGTASIVGFSSGAYSVRLSQDQALVGGCSSETTVFFDAPLAALDTVFVKVPNPTSEYELSLPETGTAARIVRIQESGLGPYEIMLKADPLDDDNWIVVDNREVRFDNLFAGDYTLSLKDGYGCLRTYVLTIGVDESIYIPNIFTPDNNGKNDSFFIRNLPDGSKLIVNDRWGKQVYSSNNYKSYFTVEGSLTEPIGDWTGEGAEDGVYYYQLQVEGGKVYTGWVEILRGPK